jgi:hypothetical protein
LFPWLPAIGQRLARKRGLSDVTHCHTDTHKHTHTHNDIHMHSTYKYKQAQVKYGGNSSLQKRK